MTGKTRIVAAVVDTQKATFYKPDGTTIEMPQGDSRLRGILEEATSSLTSQGWADIDLNTSNPWKEFEEKSNSTVRFFKVAKEKLKGLFGYRNQEKNVDAIPPMFIGNPPKKTNNLERQQAAIDEIMQHAAKSVQEPDYEESGVSIQRPTKVGEHTPNDEIHGESDAYFDESKETIVAITPKGKIVPGVERIKSQFDSAAQTGNIKGMSNFLERIGSVIEKRTHTVEDLLRFMERGDLPVADDGSIIIYKKLLRRNGVFVDCHTKKVTQVVGSFVHMHESLVDPKRSNECSSGLHVARRGYLKQFSGDVIVLAKVRPEDVITVPAYDANKMRVRAYHIIAQLNDAQFACVNNNRPICGAEGGEELLADAIAGNHIGITEYVEIKAEYGGDVVITPVEESVKSSPNKPVKAKAINKTIAKKAEVVKPKKAKTLEAKVVNSDEPVDIKQINAKKENKDVSLINQEKPLLTQKDIAKELYSDAISGNKTKAKELLELKKKGKRSWAYWGLPDDTTDILKKLTEG